jgi:hypothetical protein
MTINFNRTGAERKSLVGAISAALNAPTKYLGAPTFAYEVGGYTIDKTGTLTGADAEGLVATLIAQGFEPAEIHYDSENAVSPETSEREYAIEPEYTENGVTYQAELSDPEYPDRMEIFSAETDLEAYRFAKDYCEGEVTLLELRVLDEDYNHVRNVDIEELIAENGLYDSMAIEIPKNGMYDSQVQNLLKLAESKQTLLTKALGAPLQINDTGATLQFIYPYSEENGVGVIYSQLSAAMVKYVKRHQRITATDKEVSSERFSMRTFLVRLNLNGAEYKALRSFMARNLTGNSCFADDKSYAAMVETRKANEMKEEAVNE